MENKWNENEVYFLFIRFKAINIVATKSTTNPEKK